MLTFLLKRLATLLPTLLGITLVAFGLIRLVPGDPIEIMMGERRLDAATHAELMARMGLDQPLHVQYGQYLAQLARGDLGQSLVSREPVAKEFAALFPATVELALAALLLAVSLGLLLGVTAGLKRGSLLDQGVMGVATVGYSMPVFWWGLILIMFFSVQLGWTPVSGRIGIEYDVPVRSGFLLIDSWLSGEEGAFRSACLHLLLPATVLGTSTMAVVARMTRSSMLEVLREDYIRAARAKGLSPARVVLRHGLRNALIPVLTVIGMQTGSLLAGAVLTETIFSWPGIGKWLIDSIARRDYPVVQAGILISALTFIGVNLLVDVLYGVVNPRIRNER
ncbi:ABC transporter permease [Paucibacter sp. DJ2R-2]|uniref:ABC transporter permease n=1 Tax=Paucibacter sp. DJ2R-2 TaxID=2893558 RepID=UPI0021E441FC|nr:ABC transporter permease subunit [Paucibacter sp. DJ2R-2]MCV2421342.1 ABC transporter permease subunit [Paucibacter sp. DJ4R-1]MCV2441203.1 ABC transporter permease subunit [Paucibacter sp. DJ2R-2]